MTFQAVEAIAWLSVNLSKSSNPTSYTAKNQTNIPYQYRSLNS